MKKHDDYYPYEHDQKTLARSWAIPGTPNLEHRIGGLEKANITGNVSYDPENHDMMVRHRQNKVDIIENFIPEIEPYGNQSGKILILGWGGTYGAIRSAVEKSRKKGIDVSHIHLRHLNPFPKNLGELLVNYQKILVPELNLGQLLSIIRDKYLVDAKGLNKVAGKPFTSSEISEEINKINKG